jgi:hypothetical protein
MADSTDRTGSPVHNDGIHSLVTYEADENIFAAIDETPGSEEALDRTDLIWVTTDGTPDDVVNQLRTADMSGMPGSVDVISIGDCSRAATATKGTPSTVVVPFDPCELTVHGLRRDSDLDEIARSIMECVDHLARSDQEIVLDDLGQLVDDTSLDDVYQFLHILIGKAVIEGWTVTVGVENDTVDEQTLQTVAPLFDDVN